MIDLHKGPYYNWNRMAMLSQARIRSDEHSIEPNELGTRIDLQNMYACAKDNTIESILETIQCTITPEIKKAVDDFMKKL